MKMGRRSLSLLSRKVSDGMRKLSTRLRSKPVRYSTLVLLSAALVLGGAVAVTSVTTMDPAEVVSALSRDRVESDKLPTSGRNGDPIRHDLLEQQSSRLLHQTSDSNYWVSIGVMKEVCLSIYFEPPQDSSDWIFGTSCSSPNAVRGEGLWLEVSGPNGGKDALLVPDGVDMAEAQEVVANAGGEMPVSNLILFPLGTRPEVLTITGPAGESLELGTLELSAG